jgi:diguanylate cyclase (GGDEF)-like protein
MAAPDRITSLARKIFGVRASFVSLIGEESQGPQRLAFFESAPLINAAGRPIGTICITDPAPRDFNETDRAILRDLAELVTDQLRLRMTSEALQAANEKLAHQATHDKLTGLANRAYFDQCLEVALTQAVCRKTRFAVFYIDLDRFKEINDDFGHRAGDLLLQKVSSRLLEASPQKSTLARLGGDEFVLLAPEVRDQLDASLMLAELTSALDNPFLIDDDQIEIKASAGFSMFPDDGETARQLLHRADARMYESKHYNGADDQADRRSSHRHILNPHYVNSSFVCSSPNDH